MAAAPVDNHDGSWCDDAILFKWLLICWLLFALFLFSLFPFLAHQLLVDFNLNPLYVSTNT